MTYAPDINAYLQTAFGGFSILQHVAANTLLQRKTGNFEAQMVCFTAPYKMKVMTISPFKLGVSVLFSNYFFMGAVPLIFFFSHAMIYARETR